MLLRESPAIVPGFGDADDEAIDPYRVVMAFWRARWVVFTGVTTCALAAALLTSLVPKTYTATATVVVTPPTFTTALSGQPLSVEAYTRLAESDLVKARVQQHLEEQHFFAGRPEDLALRTVLYSSRQPQQPYLPLVGLSAEWRTPAGAQTVANTWAQTLVEEGTRISTANTAASVDFVVKEFPQAATAVADAERELAEVRARQAAELSRARIESGVDPREEKNAGAATAAATAPRDRDDAEPQPPASLLLRVEDRDARGPKQARVRSQEALVASLQQQLVQTRVDIDSLRSRLNGATGSDSRSTAAATAPEAAGDRLRLAALESASEALVRELRAARAAAEGLRAELVAGEVRVDNLVGRHEVERLVYERKVAEAKAKLKPLQDKIGDAQIAQAQREPDLRIGGLAPLPPYPTSPSLRINVLAATGIGLLLGMFGAWIAGRAHDETEAARTAR